MTPRWTGRLERREVEGGSWVLVTARETWALYGEIPARLEGSRIEVDGEEAFGIGMAGPGIEVRAVRPA